MHAATRDQASIAGSRGPLAIAPGLREQQLARLWLLALAVGMVTLHAVLVGLDRPINWDEAIHVSQVNPARPAVYFEPHRTRGLALLVAPVAVFDPTMPVLRTYLVLLVAGGTFGAFATWIPLIGRAAPLAATVYSSYWVTVFYTVEVLPNPPAALLAVALTGITVRALVDDPVPRQGWLLLGLFALFALIRPPDAALVGVGLAGVAVAIGRREALRSVATPAAVGGLVGIVPWLVEGWVRFGFGPLTTARSASEYSADGGGANLLPLYLSSLETRLRCAGSCIDDFVEAGAGWHLPPARTTSFLAVAAILGVVGLATVRHRPAVGIAPIAASVPLIAFYAAGGGAMNLRYLLPVFALLLIPPAIGVSRIWRVLDRGPRFAAISLRILLAAAITLACAWSIGLAIDRFERPSTRDRAAILGQQLARASGDEPCVVASRVNYPQIQYWSGCLATSAGSARAGQLQPPLGELGSYVDIAAAGRAGARVFAIDRVEPREGSPLDGWERVYPDAEPVDGYVLYEHVPGAALPPPPCPPVDVGPERTLGGVLSGDC